MTVELVDVPWRDRIVTIEHRWIGPRAAPLVVFLHEGLGSQAMWKDFPDRLCEAAGCSGLVYSRPGYGSSTPRPGEERWGPDFMHRQAHEVLPALLQALDVDVDRRRPWLLGHSDGGSIALLHAAKFVRSVAGVVVLAPHILVEDISVDSIEQTRLAYLHTPLRERLARYHDDPDSAFWGWNRIWLDPAFRAWDIRREIASIECPLLAIQGLDDEYGTLAQVDGIAAALPHAELAKLPECGHSPHRDQPDRVLALASDFIRRHTHTTHGDKP